MDGNERWSKSMTPEEHTRAAREERAELYHLVDVLGNDIAQSCAERHAVPELVEAAQGRNGWGTP